MNQYFIILFHFFNIIVGLISLSFIIKNPDFSIPGLQKKLTWLSSVFNLIIILTAVSDFLVYFFWAQVSSNYIAVTLLFLNNISQFALGLFWTFIFVFTINLFLEQEIKIKESPKLRILIVFLSCLVIFCFISLRFKLIPSFFSYTAMSANLLIFVIVLYYSYILVKKFGNDQTDENKISLVKFAQLFILFAVFNILITINTLLVISGIIPPVIPPFVNKYLFQSSDGLFNIIILYWIIRYFPKNSNFQPSYSNPSELVDKYQISKRELEIIHFVCQGKSNQEIADQLFISLGTVKDHLYRIYKKIGIKNRTQLANLFNLTDQK